MKSARTSHLALLFIVAIVFCWSGWRPHDRFTWWLEIAPGHFMQGFVPAMIAREVFIRLNVVNRKKWIPFLIVSVCLAISAFYELVEWWMAIISGSAANDFIGSQGDVWDTQEDMLLALIGAVCALLLLSYFHDRALRNIAERTS